MARDTLEILKADKISELKEETADQKNATGILKSLGEFFRPLIDQCTRLIMCIFVVQCVLSVLHYYPGINSEKESVDGPWLAFLLISAIACFSIWTLWIANQAFRKGRSIRKTIKQLNDKPKKNYLAEETGIPPD